jgi:thymidine kinase
MKNNLLTEKEIKELLENENEVKNYQNSNDPKEIFIDAVNPDKYIELDSNFLAFERVTRTLNRNLKMILVYGAPGTGKSMFLSRLHNELLAHSKYSILIASPILDEVQFIKTISFEIFRQSTLLQTPQDLNSLINSFKSESEYLDRIRPILLLDEAQLYPNSTIEKIRILADTLKLRVVFVVHQLKEEDIFSQEHFKSRIWEKIELKNASLNELRIYIQKKLMSASALSLANQFSKRIVRRIYKITKGNYRVTNNLLYSYFNNYPQLYTQTISAPKLKVRAKEIEITAINIGLLKIDVNDDFDCQDLSVATEVWKLWIQKKLLKYSIIVVVPTIIYIGVQIGLSFLYSRSNNQVNSEIVAELNSDDNLSEELNVEFISEPSKLKTDFEVPKYEEIIEKNSTNNEVAGEELNPFSDEVNLTTKNNQTIVANKIKLKEEKNTTKQVKKVVVEKKKEGNLSDKNSSIAVSQKPPHQEKPEKSVKSLFANLNLPTRPSLESLNIPEIYFYDPLFLKPNLNSINVKFPEKQSESKYILDLEKDFYKNKTIDKAIKILNFYKHKNNYYKVYKFSMELNKLDVNLKEPYINILQILKQLKISSYVKKVQDALDNKK